jgi:molybdopterin converting factor small subunit
MKVQVLFFGATADAVGEREIEIDLETGAKAADALARIVERFPQLEKHSLLFAVNQEYASGGETIRSGDELAVFTAVSGG